MILNLASLTWYLVVSGRFVYQIFPKVELQLQLEFLEIEACETSQEIKIEFLVLVQRLQNPKCVLFLSEAKLLFLQRTIDS